jgi:uncharacterized protein
MTHGGLHGRMAWHELMTTDPAAAEAFYRGVVGWGTQPFPGMDTAYTTWMSGDVAAGGLMELPAEARAGGAPPAWLFYVAVDDAEATAARARSLGARVEVEPREVPGVGRFAVLADPQGAVFAILQPADPAPYSGPETVPAPLEISWRELATTDPAAATAFYTSLFGWERQGASDTGPTGVYQEFGRPGLPLGGIFRTPDDRPGPPRWLLYAKVHDIRASAEAVKALGGTVLDGPMEIPGGDLVCQIVDPQGAAFALHQAKG